MNPWNRIAGRRRTGAVRARPGLAALAALLVLSGSEEWIAAPLPDGGTFYVRYGKPGGVRIQRGRPAEDAATVAVAPGAAVSPGATPSGALAPPSAAWADSLAAQVRRILAEELATLPASPRYTIEIVRPHAAQVPDTFAVPAPSVRGGRAPDTLGVLPELRFAPPDSAVTIPAIVAPPLRVPAPAPPVPAIPPVHVETSPEIDRAMLPPEPRTVREAFTSDGLFTTQLLLFETADSTLLPISRDILAVVAGVLREFPEAHVRVEGYTDHRGGAQANLELSRRRAQAVRDYLVLDGGLDPGRVEAVGYGEERPVIEGSTPTALALNRRVQIRVLNPEALRRSVEDR